MSIDHRSNSKEKLPAPFPLPYVSRKALKRVKHPSVKPTECRYCNGAVELVGNEQIYRGRSYGEWPYAYLCRPCDAFVGLHPDTDIPLGTLANRELREARKKAKDEFHKMIRLEGGGRTFWYSQLAIKMGISVRECHFGMFDLDRCAHALSTCQKIQDGYL